jgi:hypothetical protein
VAAALEGRADQTQAATEAIPFSTPSLAREVVAVALGVVPEMVEPEDRGAALAETHREHAEPAPAGKETTVAVRLHLASSLVAVVGAVQMQ